MVPRDRIELPSARCKHAALPLDERGLFGGSGEIRTHGAFRHAGFQDPSHRPLDHTS